MKITYPKKESDVAELEIDGKLVRYAIPPVIGTHSEVFQALSADIAAKKISRIAQGREIVAYANGCLVYKQNEWADQNRVKFPSQNYLRFPNVLTIIPNRKEFGDLAGGMLIDSDLVGKAGQRLSRETSVPKDLAGWMGASTGLLVKDKRIFVPYNLWYEDSWNGKNGAVRALAGGDGAEVLERTAVDSGRIMALWKVDVNSIETPEKRVPVLNGNLNLRLLLDCGNYGSGDGCGVGVK